MSDEYEKAMNSKTKKEVRTSSWCVGIVLCALCECVGIVLCALCECVVCMCYESGEGQIRLKTPEKGGKSSKVGLNFVLF
jgi:hypothetical protein